MADILRPELVWIEGRCYRLNEPVAELSSFQEHDLYEHEPDYEDVEEEEDDIEVTMISDSRYSTSFHVPKHYQGAIIGKRGATKMRIEHETRTTIKIPKPGQSGEIVILGSSAGSVKTARRRIDMIVVSSRMKQKNTHFISIPLNKPEIMENFERFKNAVLKECPDRGIEEAIFTKAAKLHLTVGVMCLMDNEERTVAAHLLMDARDEIIVPMLQNHEPLMIRMKGISYMNDDPKDVHVLYATVEQESGPEGLLQRLANALLKHFYKAGYMKADNDLLTVKLHATLMNSRYRNKDTEDLEDNGKYRKPRESFDASRVLQQFANFDFGVVELTEIHLSVMNFYGEDGYYQPSCVISCY